MRIEIFALFSSFLFSPFFYILFYTDHRRSLGNTRTIIAIVWIYTFPFWNANFFVLFNLIQNADARALINDNSLLKFYKVNLFFFCVARIYDLTDIKYCISIFSHKNKCNAFLISVYAIKEKITYIKLKKNMKNVCFSGYLFAFHFSVDNYFR